MTIEELTECATKAKEGAYAPYSGFRVGAALLCKSGKVFTGFNIENGSFGACMCAERIAIYRALSEGEREFEAIAVAGGDDICPPCGICRQVMSEFCSLDFKIYLIGGGKTECHTLGELLPLAFNLR